MNNMTNVFIILGGIFLFATVLVVLDAVGRRQRRNARKGALAARQSLHR